MATPRPGASGSLVRAGAALAVMTGVGNVLAYVTTVVLSRALGPADYGAVAALVGLAVVASVPAVALQLVAARGVVTTLAVEGPAGLPGLTRHLVRFAAVVATIVAAACVAAAPGLERVLTLGSPLAVVATAAAVGLVTVTSVVQGLLQGEQRFVALGTVVLTGWAGRLVAAVACAVADAGVTVVMTGMAVATAVQLGVGAALHARWRAHPEAVADAPRTRPSVGELTATVVATGGLLLLTNVDVLLARGYLDETTSGLYAVGSLFAKAAFWGPQFVATLLFPRLAAGSAAGGVLARGIAMTAGLGALVVVPAAVIAAPLVTTVAGTAYAGVAPALWLFAVLGSCLALMQLLVYAGLARGDRRGGIAPWGAAALQSGLIVAGLNDSVTEIASAALVSVATLFVGLAVYEWRSHAAAHSAGSAGHGPGTNCVTSPGAFDAAAVNAAEPG